MEPQIGPEVYWAGQDGRWDRRSGPRFTGRARMEPGTADRAGGLLDKRR